MPNGKRNATVAGLRGGRSGRMRRLLAVLGALGMAAAVGGCVVVPARPVAYRPVVVRPYAFVVY
jgi:hypothetical protein